MADENLRRNGEENSNEREQKSGANYENEKNTLVISPIAGEEKPNRLTFIEVLAKLSPGKSLRTGLDDILKGNTGALIVVDCPEIRNAFEGGFKVNCKFTSQRLSELAKMDGAIILARDMKKILFANTLLVPDSRISTDETGTRHKAAERTAKQTGAIVIAVSERRKKISLFYDNKKYVLQDSEDILRRATETLQILEKQREILDENFINFNILEITNLVSYGDICSILQRLEMIIRMMNTIKRYLIELGNEGIIIKMRVNELSKGIMEKRDMIISDYTERSQYVLRLLENVSSDMLTDTGSLSRMLFGEFPDKIVSSKGRRLLSKVELSENDIEVMTSYFGNIVNVINASEDDMRKVIKSKTGAFREQLEALKEKIMIGKKI